jgi:hypothetical protein
MAGHVVHVTVKRNTYRIVVGNPEETTSKHIYRWEGDIKMDIRGILMGDMDCTDLAWDGDM